MSAGIIDATEHPLEDGSTCRVERRGPRATMVSRHNGRGGMRCVWATLLTGRTEIEVERQVTEVVHAMSLDPRKFYRWNPGAP